MINQDFKAHGANVERRLALGYVGRSQGVRSYEFPRIQAQFLPDVTN